ncbi:MAG TPA: iron ABC transporter permease [Rugosimonospora sp.]|nr:iron ABC transporter permease [Rugosimonospora sp.]
MTAIPVGERPERESVLRRVPYFGLLVGVIVLGMAALVVYPIVRMIYDVFGTDRFGDQQVSSVFSDPELWPAVLNTVVLIVAGGLGALLIGTILAWLNERTDARLNWAADVLPIIPLLIPSIAVAVGWVFLFAPRAGLVNVLLRWAFHSHATGLAASGPINIYTLTGIVIVTIIITVPYPYLIMSAALQNVDPALEEASRMSGRGPVATFFRVTLPAVRNAIATASSILVLIIMAMFAAPIVIGLQGGIDVLSTHIFNVVYAVSPPRLAEGIVLSTLMLVAAQLTVLVEYLVTRSGHHATIGGRSHTRSLTRLGALRIPARILILGYVAVTTVAPFIALLLVSFQGFWTAQVDWSKLSLVNYRQLFNQGSAFAAGLTNSVILAVAAATILMVVSALIAFFVHNAPGRLGGIVNGIATLPSSIPQTVVAIGFLITLGVGALQGSLLLLLLAYLVLFLPMASRAAGSAMSQIGKDLWESSSMSGASPLRTFRKILLPLMLAGLLSGWVIVFAHTLGETNAGVFLSGASNPVVGPQILASWQINGNYSALGALTVCITIIQVAVVAVTMIVSRRRFSYRGI